MRGYNVTHPEQLVALLLHFGSEELFDNYEGLSEEAKEVAESEKASEDKFTKGVKALKVYFTPKQNTKYKKYECRHTNQMASENLEQFITRLLKLAATCEFHDVECEIKSQVIAGRLSQKLSRRGLTEPTWD